MRLAFDHTRPGDEHQRVLTEHDAITNGDFVDLQGQEHSTLYKPSQLRRRSPIAVTFVAIPCRLSCRLCAASTNPANSGCGRSGFDLNSGWNWTATYQGWPGSSTISTNFPSSERPTIRRPLSANVFSYRQLNSYRCRWRSWMISSP